MALIKDMRTLKSGFIVLCIVLSLLFSSHSAQAACWNVSGTFAVKQDNQPGVPVIFTVEQNGSQVTGNATYDKGQGVNSGSVTGSIQGDDFDLTVDWSDGKRRGNYKGKIVSGVLVGGLGKDLNDTNTTANFTVERTFTCAPAITTPTISVATPSANTFVLSGKGFLPNKVVYVRIADAYANPNVFRQSTSDGTGNFSDLRLSGLCTGVGTLHFSAHDRRDGDKFVSNVVTASCAGSSMGGQSHGQSRKSRGKDFTTKRPRDFMTTNPGKKDFKAIKGKPGLRPEIILPDGQ